MMTQSTPAQIGWRYLGSRQGSNVVIQTTARRDRKSGCAWHSAYSFPAQWRLSSLSALVLVVGLCCLATRVDRVEPKLNDSQLSTPVIAERLAHQQVEIDHLVSAIRSSAQPKVVVKSHKVDTAPHELKQDPTNEAATHAAVKDLAELSRYVKDVADSIALIDTKLSDPAVLQKKLDQERAVAHQ